MRRNRPGVDAELLSHGEIEGLLFNVADIAVSTGAFLLAWALWGEEKRHPAQPAVAEVVPEAKVSTGG